MLPKQYRLPAATRLRNSLSFSTPFFTLRVSPNEFPYSRFGFVVRKAVDKRATKRNHIRRLFRSCIEEMREEIKGGQDLLFILNGKIVEMRREDLYNEVHSFFKEKQLL
jgi:ribonuclease P protein component